MDAPPAAFVQASPSGVLGRGVTRFAAVLSRAAEAPTALITLTTDGEGLTLAGASGIPDEWLRPGRTPSGSTLAGLVLRHQQPIVITDLLADPRAPDVAPAVPGSAGPTPSAGSSTQHR
ncbi:hypothetical protein AB0G04_34615 [Actinoplanes sp. NPDC023801]|uniref:hypothetical protein n=1 Tax=Actinoplanes sp. NPDC023801 TaxID=3154595 RepID=UPI0033DF7A94